MFHLQWLIWWRFVLLCFTPFIERNLNAQISTEKGCNVILDWCYFSGRIMSLRRSTFSWRIPKRWIFIKFYLPLDHPLILLKFERATIMTLQRENRDIVQCTITKENATLERLLSGLDHAHFGDPRLQRVHPRAGRILPARLSSRARSWTGRGARRLADTVLFEASSPVPRLELPAQQWLGLPPLCQFWSTPALSAAASRSFSRSTKIFRSCVRKSLYCKNDLKSSCRSIAFPLLAEK